MKLGIFAKTFPRPTVEEVFSAVAGHGLDRVQFNFACAGLPSLPDAVEPAVLSRIRRAADANQIAIAAVSGTFNMAHPDPARRADGLRRFEAVAGTCNALGSDLITLCTGTRDPDDMWRRHRGNDDTDAWRDLCRSTHAVLELAERLQLTLGVEPETGNVVSSADLARQLLDEMKSSRLKIIMDPANLFRPGDLPQGREILERAFELLGGELVLAHGKELGADGLAGGRAIGSGPMPWEHYFRLLRGAGFQGPLILHGFEESGAAQSLEFVREAVGWPARPGADAG